MSKKGYKKASLEAGSGNDPAYLFRIRWSEEVAAGVWKQYRPTFNLNKDFPDFEERKLIGAILTKTINEALENGWRMHKDGDIRNQAYQSNNLIEALAEHTKSKSNTLSYRGAQSYRSAARLFTAFLLKNKLDKITVQEFSLVHVQMYQDYMVGAGKMPRTVNTQIGILGTIFERIRKMCRLTENPFNQAERLKQTESTLFEEWTDEELHQVSDYLKQKFPELRLVFLLVYYAWLRPASIVALKRKDFDFKALTIRVRPEGHKNRKTTVKQILAPLLAELVSAGVDQLPPELYIFSKGLKPGESPIYRNRVSEAWKEWVIDGLGINKKLYAGKHTGAADFIQHNGTVENMGFFMQQMGHSNLAESQHYINKRSRFALDESRAQVKKL